MMTKTTPGYSPWGKFSAGKYHHLAHHCADVAACFEAITDLPVIRRRLQKSAGGSLSQTIMARLAVLAFLHDIGKLHPGFQAKGWPNGFWRGSLHGHVKEGAAIFLKETLKDMALALHVKDLSQWGTDHHLLFAALAHHGRPFMPNDFAGSFWQQVPALNYDPNLAAEEIGAMMHSWFPAAFLKEEHEPLPATPVFQHFFCGLVSIADWLGSDQRIFSFMQDFDPDYITLARSRAQTAVTAIGLDRRLLRPLLADRTDFETLTGFVTPRPQQKLVADAPLNEQLLILEAETGAGKTEAALWRFVRLFEAGMVDSLYFALPTRAAALQLHSRINQALKRLFSDQAPEVILAVPGYLKAGEVEGVHLPGWQVRWDDDADEELLLARWAAENSKRYLAATVAVGTVDQVMLATLQVKHSHLRAAALSRSLLVIDEVHASDSYMTGVQGHLLDQHLGCGGHAMLMSATLGSVVCSKWLKQPTEPSFKEAVEVSYPALWMKNNSSPLVAPQEKQKNVTMASTTTMAPEETARLAITAAEQGARVLIIRNTVRAAVDTWQAVCAEEHENLLMTAGGGTALHHGRFAPEDRKLLDTAAEKALSPKTRGNQGVIVIGTQTLEQSLDIDADLLLTDLCPVDVLLQRIGRLQRHDLLRPEGFVTPRCYVMIPEDGLTPLLKPAFVNGLGGWLDNGVLHGIYRNLSSLELTKRLIEEYPAWNIPAMNRFLVESATHPEKIAALHTELGPSWENYHNQVYGKDLADMWAARQVIMPVSTHFAEVLFAANEERIRTRLGQEGARITFVNPIPGPFGQPISGLTLPAHYSRGIDPEKPATPTIKDGTLYFLSGDRTFKYTRAGLARADDA